jgi:hypothetical protein
MFLFNPRPKSEPRQEPAKAKSRQEPPKPIPIAPVDLSKRYDLYCTAIDHDRLYENVRFIGIRTFDHISEFSSGLVGGFLEIEATDGSRLLIPNFGIQMICEHGTQPFGKVLRN